jgi:hypothetical protein
VEEHLKAKIVQEALQKVVKPSHRKEIANRQIGHVMPTVSAKIVNLTI